jgi:hypothetical protein
MDPPLHPYAVTARRGYLNLPCLAYEMQTERTRPAPFLLEAEQSDDKFPPVTTNQILTVK